jgi:hypothetical protein
VAALIALALVTGCKTGQPIGAAKMGDKTTPGTIGGIVKNPGGEPVTGRTVTAVEVATRQRYTAVSTSNGGFSISVPPGEYRLEVELREGERVIQDPGTMRIHRSDLDANRDLVIGQ